MPCPIQKYLLSFFFALHSLSGIIINRDSEVSEIIGTPTTIRDLNHDHKWISWLTEGELQKRSPFSRFMNTCSGELHFRWSICTINVPLTNVAGGARFRDNKEYVVVCEDDGPPLRSYYGRCAENEICVTRGDIWPPIPNHTWAYCVSYHYYITLIYKGGSQQRAVTAAQLGLPSGESGTADYAVSALVIDSSTLTSVNATGVDVVAMVGRGGGGSRNVHCSGCDEVVMEKVPGGVTEFVLGITLKSAITAGQVILDVWKR